MKRAYLRLAPGNLASFRMALVKLALTRLAGENRDSSRDAPPPKTALVKSAPEKSARSSQPSDRMRTSLAPVNFGASLVTTSRLVKIVGRRMRASVRSAPLKLADVIVARSR